MYKRSAQGWMKHLDFILLDEVALQLAYVLAYGLRHGSFWPYTSWVYRNLGLFMLLSNALISILFNTMHNVLKRGYLKELGQTLRQAVLLFVFCTALLFSLQIGDVYSRIVLYLTLLLHIGIGYALRLLWKKLLIRRGRLESQKTSMLAVLTPDTAQEVVRRLTSTPDEGHRLVGIVLNGEGPKEIEGIPVVCPLSGAAAYICRVWVDSAYLDVSTTDPAIQQLMDACRQMAVPVHYHIPGISREGMKQFAEKIGDTTVLTTSINYATSAQLLAKRLLDILGGLIGSLATLLVMLIVGPQIKKASPGPLLYTAERIGQNGKRFRIRKIRSMYLDADARKEELMAQNRVKDGMMFKLDFDPRIIGNEILPDGTKKTGIGEFIRRTSLDEFPQFFNVLKGDMSLVGTRPPTPDEWDRYEYHHRARLACKPGITGMWQVNGRSEITDFEEVVRLDTQYIEGWSLGLDLRIILKTFGAVLGHKGAM